ncbi:hypothetical protein F5X99DRAFT_386586 [Biscogniauxia marginata]|nr:hypothetical protein F5X99DRAFT_386586 [Biscogniauxia marginata]
MASVTSLDKDLRRLRLEKYTPAAANEAQSWIEDVLGEKLSSADLLDGLKDGVALCKLVNLAGSSPVKFKKSAMPFVQMENISHFLRACRSPPLNLQEHDVFLTVDLFEKKDPAQVLQCLGAFSRAANSINPSAFPSPIGPKSRVNVVSPQSTGPAPSTARPRGLSNVSASSNGSRPSALVPSKTGDSVSSRWSPSKSPTNQGALSPGVSSWSKKNHEGVTSPAWNIAQYGYMGGASQGNLGIAFGGRRQITSAGPQVPTAAEKERKRKEKEAEAERQKLQMEEQERIRKAELEAGEERARLEEERRWEEETRRLRVEEKKKAEEEKRKWAEEERQWKLTEEKRRMEEEEAEARLAEERRRSKNQSPEQKLVAQRSGNDGYTDRIKQLEKELELARQRERQYEEERDRRLQKGTDPKSRARSRSRPRKLESTPSRQDSWSRDEREVLRTQWDRYQEEQAEEYAPRLPPRPLPNPMATALKPHRTGEIAPVKTHRTGEGRPLPIPDGIRNQTPGSTDPTPSRPLPVPSADANGNRTDRFLASNAAPIQPVPQQIYSRELDATAERDEEDRRRIKSQAKTKAAGWASKSLLEREMEMERQRQREWEESQKETANAVRTGDGVDGVGGGIGGRWDVSQWSGFTGGDSQNKGGTGIGAGRRQIVGPRPLPKRP